MCGILFNAMVNGECVDLDRFGLALQQLSHRGPDSTGIVCMPQPSEGDIKQSTLKRFGSGQKAEKSTLAIGHNRLSILDLSERSSQPFIDRSNKRGLIFNGEIYNYLEIAKPTAKTYSDTHVLFDLLCSEGVTALSRMNGMWALCYIDLVASQVWIARDRYGKKPLFYYWDQQQFIVSSEVKSIFTILGRSSRSVNRDYLSAFLVGKLTPFLHDGNSFYSEIKSVDPGGVMCLDLKNKVLRQSEPIDFPSSERTPMRSSPKGLAECLAEELRTAVALRLRSDARVAIHVSGGVDSSWIAASAKESWSQSSELGFYTCRIVDRHGNVNEDLHYSRQLCRKLGVELREVHFDPFNAEEFVQTTLKISEQTEMPTNFFLSSIALYLLARSMRADGIKVALDGIGGDEILGGYPNYQLLSRTNASAGSPIRSLSYLWHWIAFARPRLKDILYQFFKNTSALIRQDALMSPVDTTATELRPLLRTDALYKNIDWYCDRFFSRKRSLTLADTQRFEIQKFLLPYCLYMADQMSMMSSIENRSPFLDMNLRKYVGYPDSFKIKKGYNKYILRKSLPQEVPDEIRWRAGKLGIGSPFALSVLRTEAVVDVVRNSSLANQLVDVESLIKDLDISSPSGHMVRMLYSLGAVERAYKLTI